MQVVEGVKAEQVLTQGGMVSGVTTRTHGTIACRVLVNCAGLWARELGQRSAPPVSVPLHACEHLYVVSHPIEVQWFSLAK